MYIPDYFKVKNIDEILNFISENSFALILTPYKEDILNTQVPILYERNGEKITLFGHMSRENPHWKAADGKKTTVLFLGPHQYISPRWYTIEKSVPTWDYMTVKMTGILKTVDRDQANSILLKLSEFYDKKWAEKRRDREDYYQKMVNEIIAFRIEVEEVYGKWKLSQNRPVADRKKIIENLANSGNRESEVVAKMIEKYSFKKQ
jgi:transcriptional regulator